MCPSLIIFYHLYYYAPPAQHSLIHPMNPPTCLLPYAPNTHAHARAHTTRNISLCSSRLQSTAFLMTFFFSNKCDPRIREGDQCCALKFMGKNGNKIFLSLSLFPSFFPSLSILPTCSPSPFSLFSFPYLSAQHMHAHAKPTCTSDTHTHTHFFSSPVLSLSLSLLFNLLTLLLARLSQHPPCCPSSFILFLLPPSLPPSAFFSLSLSHTHIYILTQTDTRTHSHTPIYIFQLHLWQVVISTVRNCFFNIYLSNYEPS